MTTQKDRITRHLKALGAAWAVSNKKYTCTNWQCCDVLDGDKAAYHIHPDQSYPHQNSIQRFASLAALELWIRETSQAQQEQTIRNTQLCQDVSLRSLTKLAELTSIPRQTLYWAARRGQLEATKSGRTWLATVNAVEVYRASRVHLSKR